MIKVNLISKKRRLSDGKNWTKILTYSLFGLFLTYFVGVTLYITISIYVFNNKIKKADNESLSISKEMLSNNNKLSSFVLTKLILSEIENINITRFRYKDYLDQISMILPQNNVLMSVDFKTKGWVSISVTSSDVFSFQSLEKVLLNKDIWSNSKFFSGAYIEGVSKNIDNLYNTRLHFELKKNG